MKPKTDCHKRSICPLCDGEGDQTPKIIQGWGLCSKHLKQQRKLRPIDICSSCKKTDVIYATGLCRKCWVKLNAPPKPAYIPKPKNYKIKGERITITINESIAKRLKEASDKCRLSVNNFIVEAIEVVLAGRGI